MAVIWASVHVMLWTILCLFTTSVCASPCAEARTPSALVPVGSSVQASCRIKADCPLTAGSQFSVMWPYNTNLSYTALSSQDQSVHTVLILNLTQAVMLECAVCVHHDCNVVAGVEIRAAYPPAAPQNLACVLNLTEPFSLMCSWDPGQKTSIPTNYSLHTEIRYPSQSFIYNTAPGQHYYRVPRVGFALFNKVRVQVTAVNVLGRSSSESLVLDPMETAKLEPPHIDTVASEKFGCLGFSWSLSQAQKWITRTLFIQISLKPRISSDKEQVVLKKARSGHTVEVCALLNGMLYEVRMRVRYLSSPWTDWSLPTEATTLIRAPTGRLVTWLKLLGPPVKKQYRAELFWKPSLQFRANSVNVSYTVTLLRPHSKYTTVCNTKHQRCSFQLPVNIRKIQITAMNTAGRSNPTDVTVHRHTELDSVPFVKVSPQSEESVLTEWTSPVSSLISGYVLEWTALLQDSPDNVSFQTVDKNQLSFLVSGLQPYQPYELRVYVQYKSGYDQGYSVMMYSRQKAPSESPVLKFGEIRSSYVELFWEEIPLQQRNGIITGYRVFYWDHKNNTGILDVSEMEKRVVLKDLQPSSIYNILLMSSTSGGSINSSIFTIKTPSIDAFGIVLIVIPACVGLTLLILGMFTCFGSDEWLKKCVWPMIPDPANSSIKRWTTDSVQDLPSFTEVKDPVLVYLSHFSLLSLSEKELWKGEKYLNCEKWTYDDDSAEDDHSLHSSGIYNSGSQSESVPYATVVFANPYCTQPAAPPAYLRSESTQPLLAEEEPSSPNPYDLNHKTHTPAQHFSTFQEAKKEEVSLWEDFPMLKSLEMTSSPGQA